MAHSPTVRPAAVQDLRQSAITIMRAGLAAADAGNAVRRHFSLPSKEFSRISLVSVGKASVAMAQAIEEIVPRLDSVLVVTKEGHASNTPSHWLVVEAGHPLPDRRNARAATLVHEYAKDLGQNDLLIVAVSGGASALLTAPVHPLTLQDKRQTTNILLRAGADIYELNTVRKHLSSLKGGGLVKAAYPAHMIGLLLSDVIGDSPAVIGSGLTAPDPTTYAHALQILRKYDVREQVPQPVLSVLQEGANGGRNETPKPGDTIFANVQNTVVGSNTLALDAAADQARALGFSTIVLPDKVQGEARGVAQEHVSLLRNALKQANPYQTVCILSGGEPTVTVTGTGKGGRNQEFALAAALSLNDEFDAVVLSIGTDGTDGPTDAAGAIADQQTVGRATSLHLDAERFLRDNDSYHFFETLGDLIKTGPTATNVMDLQLMLARRKEPSLVIRREGTDAPTFHDH